LATSRDWNSFIFYFDGEIVDASDDDLAIVCHDPSRDDMHSGWFFITIDIDGTAR